jgi:hypothetical protein
MRQFVHVTVADLAAYREDPGDVPFNKLKLWDGLGEAATITSTLRDELAWIQKNGIEGAERRKRQKLQGHRLVDSSGLTERGKVLLELYS